MPEIFYEVTRDYSTNVYHSLGKNDSLLHFHQQLELLYVEKGEVEVRVNDVKKILTAGQLVVCDSFDNHQYTHIADAVSRCLIIPIQYLKRYTTLLSDKSLQERFILDPLHAKKIYDKMLDVVEVLNANKNELILEGTISILLGTIIENNLVTDTNKTSYDLVKNILLYIENNHKNAITLDVIAKHFGYSKYYFSHLFNKCFQCNLNDYLNLVRCRHSISYVVDDHLSVADAAFASGFVSMRTFYRTFKKYFDMTPKEYFHNINE